MNLDHQCAHCRKPFVYGEALVNVGSLRYCMGCVHRDHYLEGAVPVDDLKQLLPEQRKPGQGLRPGPHFFGDGCDAPHGTERRATI